MRLIDADAIMEALSIFNDKENGNAHFLNGIETAKEIIADAPTIEAEDVRRGMCIHCIMHDEPTVEAEPTRKWTNVSDSLPETRHAVLAFTPHHSNIWALSLHEDRNWYYWMDGNRQYDPLWMGAITHWMPMPDAPEVEE